MYNQLFLESQSEHFFFFSSFLTLCEKHKKPTCIWISSIVSQFFLRYVILATTTVSTFIKYVFYLCDMFMEGQWENRAVYTFYLELVRDLLHLSLYLCFFLVIFL